MIEITEIRLKSSQFYDKTSVECKRKMKLVARDQIELSLDDFLDVQYRNLMRRKNVETAFM